MKFLLFVYFPQMYSKPIFAVNKFGNEAIVLITIGYNIT